MKNLEINGNVSGIRDTVLDRLKELYDLKSRDTIVSKEIIEKLCEITQVVSREISVFITRDGNVVDVSIGSGDNIKMPSMSYTRGLDNLCGVRCIHTHPKGSGLLSSVDVGTLRSAKFDAMVAIGVNDGKPKDISVGILSKQDDAEGVLPEIFGMFTVGKIPHDPLFDKIQEAIVINRNQEFIEEAERVVLIGLDNNQGYDSLKELEKLCENADLNVVGVLSQKREKPDNATYVGKGKMEELSLLCSSVRADVCVCDDEISSKQMKNLEEELNLKVVDRTTLILEIFAKRAKTREGKLQVELAQLKYRLPRLYGMGKVLSRLGGGIGTRNGSGEKKLEIDQRHIRRRVYELEKEIASLQKQREVKHEKAVSSSTPVVALVGYTNSGKSTMLNLLSHADVFAKDKLFATLDTVVRKVAYKSNMEFYLVDTVGFINKLPTDLISSFKSTLEEAKYADLILHIVDYSSDYYKVQMDVVDNILADLDIKDIPIITVYNKADMVEEKSTNTADSVYVSAKNGDGIEELIDCIENTLVKKYEEIEVVIPYSKGHLQSIMRKGTIISEEYVEEGIKIKALLTSSDVGKLKSQL